MELEFPRQIFQKTKNKKKTLISSLIKIRPLASELFHMDRRDEANSRFSQTCTSSVQDVTR